MKFIECIEMFKSGECDGLMYGHHKDFILKIDIDTSGKDQILRGFNIKDGTKKEIVFGIGAYLDDNWHPMKYIPPIDEEWISVEKSEPIKLDGDHKFTIAKEE